MIAMITRLKVIVLLCALFFWGCGDNGTGVEVEEGEPPEIPELQAAQPDFSYFQGSQKAGRTQIQSQHSFGTAQSMALGTQYLFTVGQMGMAFFEMAKNHTAEFEDGRWEWSYSASQEGETIEVRLTAEVNESSNEATWTMYISASGGEQELDNFKFMEGTVSLDGTSGEWKVYDYIEGSESQPVLTYDWSIDDEDNLMATFNFEGAGADFSSLAYAQEGATHTLMLDEGSGRGFEIYWDTENDHGYFWGESEELRLCWGSGKVDIECSEIGYMIPA
jgi:hypothetical protein